MSHNRPKKLLFQDIKDKKAAWVDCKDQNNSAEGVRKLYSLTFLY